MTEITTIFNQMKEDELQCDIDCFENCSNIKQRDINKHCSSMRKKNAKDAEMIETFTNFANINTIEEMMELGIDGVRYGNCETAYDNLYRLAKKCFRGNENREHFASSTLYYFWQNFAFDKGLMAQRIISNGVETIEPIGEKADIFKRA